MGTTNDDRYFIRIFSLSPLISSETFSLFFSFPLCSLLSLCFFGGWAFYWVFYWSTKRGGLGLLAWFSAWRGVGVGLSLGLGLHRSQPGVAVLDDLGLGLSFCAAGLGLGWWSRAGLVLLVWFCRLGLHWSQPGVAVLDDLSLGLSFCAAGLGLGWWSRASLVLLVWFCRQRWSAWGFVCWSLWLCSGGREM